ncbi:MAG: Flp pilus assembly protein CpaB [Pirellulaceae bacterium]|jgi:pilus assembly protein CpaB|nr:Flp pilus assembly protein CpaB [Pirellulaceae bacterium]
MRMKSLILIFIALACGLVASIGISQVIDRGNPTSNVEYEQILVALADIDINTKLDAQNVKLEDWPKAKVPEGALRRLEDVEGKYANSRYYKGEPLHISKVTDQLGGSISKSIPPGFRALPVKVEEDTVLKAISPGDRVDVMVFLKKSDEIPETGTFTILKNVRVFAVATNTERNSGGETDGKPETTNFRTISLLLKPEHARELTVAAQMGKILLTMRHPTEQDDIDGEEVTPIKDLLSGHSKLASDPVPVDQGPASSFLNTVQSAVSQATPVLPPAHTMQVWGPATVEQYEWTSVTGLPTRADQGQAPALQSTPAPAATEPVAPTVGEDGPETTVGPEAAPPASRQY